MIYYGSKIGDWKAAELGAEEMIAESGSEPRDKAISHFQLASVLMAKASQLTNSKLSRAPTTNSAQL
jgi:hypothetical protein